MASGSASTSKSTANEEENYKLDTETIRVQAKIVFEAAKVVDKEKKNILRKQKKTKKSKELPNCKENYTNNLIDLKDAMMRIGTEMQIETIVDKDNDESGYTGQTTGRNLAAKRQTSLREKREDKRQKMQDTFRSSQSECLKCLTKERKIEDLQKEINELKNSLERNEKEKENYLNQVFRSKDELEKQYKAEIEHLKRKNEEEMRAKEDALRNLNQVFRSKHELEKQYKAEKEHLQRKYEEEMRAKEDALRRLSSMASSKLRDNNPNITDLSDQNRPTKIAEKLSELYDNQWTDAYDALERDGMDERQIIGTLLDALMEIYYECRRLSSENFFERVQRSIELPAEANEITIRNLALSDQLKQQIKEFRKARASAVSKDIEKVLMPRIQLATHQASQVHGFLSRCVEIGWLCAVQDPPLVLNAQSSRGFDTNMYKDYTKRGKYVEYVVWPALYLQEGGALLAKGVAQGIDHVQTSTKDDSYGKQPPRGLPDSSVQEPSVRKASDTDNKRERRNNPPTTHPDQQRHISHVQSNHSSSSKTGTQNYNEKAQSVYSARTTNVTTVYVKGAECDSRSTAI